MEADALEDLKSRTRSIGAKYPNRLDRSRRIYIENRAQSLSDDRDVEYSIKKDMAEHFSIQYRDVCFCGSAQLGFSINKDKLFTKQVFDLDIACVNGDLFQRSWIDVIETSKAFSDLTVFSGSSKRSFELFKDQILRRGMIRVKLMPRSSTSLVWQDFERKMTRKYRHIFKSVSVAIYMNEYAFCWKQDSALAQLIEG